MMSGNKKSIAKFDETVAEYNKKIHKWAINQNKSQQELLSEDCSMDICVSENLSDVLYIKSVIKNMDPENFSNICLKSSTSCNIGYFSGAINWISADHYYILTGSKVVLTSIVVGTGHIYGNAMIGWLVGAGLCFSDYYINGSIVACLSALTVLEVLFITKNYAVLKLIEILDDNRNKVMKFAEEFDRDFKHGDTEVEQYDVSPSIAGSNIHKISESCIIVDHIVE